MNTMNLCSDGETSPYNIYKFSGKLYNENNSNSQYDLQFRKFQNSQGATIYTFKYDPKTGDAQLFQEILKELIDTTIMK